MSEGLRFDVSPAALFEAQELLGFAITEPLLRGLEQSFSAIHPSLSGMSGALADVASAVNSLASKLSTRLNEISRQLDSVTAALENPSQNAGAERTRMAFLALSHMWWPDAERDARASIEAYPYRGAPFLALGLALVGQSKLAQALDALETAVERGQAADPESALVAALQAEAIADALGLPARAVAVLRSATKLGDVLEPWARLAHRREVPASEVAMRWPRSLGAASPQLTMAWNVGAFRRLALGDIDRMDEALQRCHGSLIDAAKANADLARRIYSGSSGSPVPQEATIVVGGGHCAVPVFRFAVAATAQSAIEAATREKRANSERVGAECQSLSSLQDRPRPNALLRGERTRHNEFIEAATRVRDELLATQARLSRTPDYSQAGATLPMASTLVGFHSPSLTEIRNPEGSVRVQANDDWAKTLDPQRQISLPLTVSYTVSWDWWQAWLGVDTRVRESEAPSAESPTVRPTPLLAPPPPPVRPDKKSERWHRG